MFNLLARVFARKPTSVTTPAPVFKTKLGLTALEARDAPAVLAVGALPGAPTGAAPPMQQARAVSARSLNPQPLPP